ncbi:MAG: STAS domain-containing protein [Planctomycetota bacterium]
MSSQVEVVSAERHVPPDAAPVISTEIENGVLIVRFNTPEVKDIGYARRVSSDLKKLAIAIGGNMLLSLDNVEFLSSVGVATIVSFNRVLRTAGGRLVICRMRPVIRGLFSASGLDEVMEIYDTKAAALWAFRSTVS